eukprot:7693953-Prorocentrum_lima.AAC.1
MACRQEKLHRSSRVTAVSKSARTDWEGLSPSSNAGTQPRTRSDNSCSDWGVRGSTSWQVHVGLLSMPTCVHVCASSGGHCSKGPGGLCSRCWHKTACQR